MIGVTARATVLSAAAVLAACGFTDRPDAWVAVVDTLPNGALHVVNEPPARGIAPTWVIEEELRIGTMDGAGPASFGEVKGIAALRDGRIAVLDAQAKELRLFDPDGGYLLTFGRQGSGPGEMEAPLGLMASPSDELWVPDNRVARMSVFDPDEGFVRSYPLRVLMYGYVWGGTMAPDGRILKPSITLDADRSYLLRVYDREMTLTDSLRMPGYPDVDEDDPPHAYTFGSREAGRWGMMGVPFYPGNTRVLDPAGVFWSTAFGDPAYRIFRWNPGAMDTTLVIETRRPFVPVTAAERDSALAPLAERLERFGAPPPDPSKVPAVKPAVAGMFVAADGRLWVRTPTPDSLLTYDIYERDGRYAGTAVTALRVVSFLDPVVRGDRFWALVRDDMDVQYVVRGRIRPASIDTDGP